MTFLETTHLSIGYGRKKVQTDLNLSAEQGSLVCLLGTNGCGKSTLLRTLACLQAPLSGTIAINGQALSSKTTQELSLLFSLVLTDVVSVENLRVYDLVALGRTPYTGWFGNLSSTDETIIRKAIEDVNLSHKSNDFLQELSDGEKQRAVIAKALAQDTPLVLLDEPTAHLDLPNRIEIMLLLKRLADETGKCFIVSMHELELAMQIADCVWLMSENGVESGIPEDLMLSGAFHRCFASNNYHFSKNDGHFSLNHQYCGKTVTVHGIDNDRKTWLLLALKRYGYDVVSDSSIEICVEQNYFWVNGSCCETISEVLKILTIFAAK